MADDHTILRDALRAIIETQSDMKIAAMAENGRSAILMAREHQPDVVIMDISMPDLNGIDAAHQIINEFPAMKIIALSMHSNKHFVEGMLKAGASGYLLKDCALDELIYAIYAVMNDQIYLSPGIAGTVVKGFLTQTEKSKSPKSEELTKREREVLQLLAEGNKNKVIALHLDVSTKTIESHRRKLMYKLKVNNLAGLTKIAIRMGLTTLDV